MSRRVPNCYIDETPPTSTPAAVDRLDLYEVAELTWENGHLGLHGLGPPRLTTTPPSKYSTGTTTGGTLESIVDQATRLLNPKPTTDDDLVPARRFSRDALVPCSNLHEPGGGGGGGGVGSTRVGSCSDGRSMKRARPAPEWSVSVSERFTMDTCGFTSTSMGSQGNTMDDHDSVCHSRSLQMEGEEEEGKKAESKSSKRSRAAAIHNQSERKRRDKINQRMKTLQKLVPNSSKTDKASMLDEVIEYLKQLQAQVSMVSRMNMPSMMLPAIAMQQQQLHQLSLMSNNPMGLGFNMGMPPGLGLQANMMTNPFVSMTSPPWDASSSNDPRLHQSPLISDPMATFLSCSSQPTTMEAYNRMAALYQQMQQHVPPSSNPK